jgi:hypothetical protein
LIRDAVSGRKRQGFNFSLAVKLYVYRLLMIRPRSGGRWFAMERQMHTLYAARCMKRLSILDWLSIMPARLTLPLNAAFCFSSSPTSSDINLNDSFFARCCIF